MGDQEKGFSYGAQTRLSSVVYGLKSEAESDCIGDPTQHHLYSVLKAANFSDLTLSFGKRDFRVHKCILFASSGYFERMLRESWKDSVRCEIKFDEEISEDLFFIFLTFLYTNLITKVNAGNFQFQLFTLSDYFQVPKLKKILISQMKNNINPTSLQLILKFFDEYPAEDPALLEIVISYISRDFYQLAKNDFPLELIKPEIMKRVLIKIGEEISREKCSTFGFYRRSNDNL